MIRAYWLLTLLMPVSYYFEVADIHLRVQLFLFTFLIFPSLEGEKLFILLVTRYYLISDIFFDISIYRAIVENTLFFSWALWLHIRPEIGAFPMDKDNIHLAFYKGEKGSPFNRVGALFGLRVKSLCIVTPQGALRIKNGIYTMVEPKTIEESSNYLIIDTGIKSTDSFYSRMRKYQGLGVINFVTISNCIGIISELLTDIDERFKPNGILEYIPSVYLKKVLKNGIR